jgi:hypothetical protein
LELRRELAERLAAHGIRVGKNIDGVVIDLLEAGLRRWHADLLERIDPQAYRLRPVAK